MASNEHSANGNGHRAPLPPATPEELNEDLIHEARRVGPRMRTLLIIFGSLFVFGLIGLVVGILSDLMYVFVDPRIDFEKREG